MYKDYYQQVEKQPAVAGSALTQSAVTIGVSDKTSASVVGSYSQTKVLPTVVLTVDSKQDGYLANYSARIPKTYSSGWACPTVKLIS